MSRIDRRIKGTVRLEVCGACPETVLNACAMNALELMELESIDACTLPISASVRSKPPLAIVPQMGTTRIAKNIMMPWMKSVRATARKPPTSV